MPAGRPWGAVDPNSAHQLWSRWRFVVHANAHKLPTRADVRENLRGWARAGFRSTVGHCRLDQPSLLTYVMTVEIEGPPAHDPDYRASVARDFVDRFVAIGFGPGARLHRMEVGILAGDQQDGRPRDQLIVLPALPALPAVVVDP